LSGKSDIATAMESGVVSAQQSAQQAHLASVLEWWKAFDLDGRRLGLDKQALALQDAKETSQKNRRKLQEATQEFKKKSAEEKMVGLKDMLKVYQGEIDNLTRRCKSSDNAFLALYRGLYEAPDPAPALTQMQDQCSNDGQLVLELEHAKRDLVQYEKEFAELKNQEVTIRRLEEMIEDLEAQSEEQVLAKVQARAQEVEAQALIKVQETLEREKALQKKLEEAEEGYAEARRHTESARNDLFEMQAKAEDRAAALATEQELLMETNDQLQAHILTLQRECGQLKKKLDAVLNPDGNAEIPEDSTKNRQADLEQQLGEALAAASRAERQLSTATLAAHHQEANLSSELRATKAELAKLHQDKEKLEEDLAQRPGRQEMEALQRQLRMLQQLEYNGVDDSGIDSKDRDFPTLTDPEKVGSPEDTSGHAERTMEQVLMLRIRRLENEIGSLKRSLKESQEESSRYQQALSHAEELAEDKSKLVAELEDQLLQKFGGPGTPGSGGNQASSLSDLLGTTHLDPQPLAKTQSADGGGGAPAPATGGDSMLKIVQAQRDRFRQRIQELEKDKQQLLTELLSEKSASEQLQKDNLALYEKIRFLQSYRTKNARQNAAVSPRQMEEGLKDAPLDSKYQQSYEQGLNPFQQFSQAERQRKYGELSFAEKITLTTTRTLLSSKIGRSFLFFYVLAMHLLVFITLYHWAHTSSCVTPLDTSNSHPMQPLPPHEE